MPVKPNKKLQIEGRRRQVAELYVQGHTQASIAEKLGVRQGTISADLLHIRRQWRASTLRNFDAACELELQKYDRIEREAWAAWDRSQKPAQSAVINGNGSGQPARKSIKNQHGDMRALDVVLRCCAARRELLGLNAPLRIAPVMPDGMQPYRLAVESLSVVELRALSRLRERALPASEDQEHGD